MCIMLVLCTVCVPDESSKDMGGLLQEQGRDFLFYQAGKPVTCPYVAASLDTYNSKELSLALSQHGLQRCVVNSQCHNTFAAGTKEAAALNNNRLLSQPVSVIRKVHGGGPSHTSKPWFVCCGLYEVCV